MKNYVEHFFTFIFVICISLVKCPLRYFPCFNYFLLLYFKTFFTLDTSLLSDIWLASVFSHFVACFLFWESLTQQIYFLMFLFIFERETEHEWRRGRKREEDTDAEAASRLWDVSTEPDVGLELLNHEIMTWAEVRHNQLSHPGTPTKQIFLILIKSTFKSSSFADSYR